MVRGRTVLRGGRNVVNLRARRFVGEEMLLGHDPCGSVVEEAAQGFLSKLKRALLSHPGLGLHNLGLSEAGLPAPGTRYD